MRCPLHFAIERAGPIRETSASASSPIGSGSRAKREPFAAESANDYRFAGRLAKTAAYAVTAGQKSHGHIIAAAMEILGDGRSHSAEEILKLALERNLYDSSVSEKYVYTALIEYIARAIGNGRKPGIVQNADRSFRINEPPDEWPALPDAPAKQPVPEISALIARLEAAAQGLPADFELAVCDAFAALGFDATHVGGQKAPDGILDAPLGPIAYRCVVECKSSDEGINDPNVFESSKYKEGFGAQYCALVGRAFSGETSLVKELQNHGVSAWTVADLTALLREGSNPFEMRALVVPGFASDAIEDLFWERTHGQPKRVRLIAEAILRTGWTTQSAYRGSAAEAPRLTEDVAMVLVDQDLAAQGSAAACSREDV
ncbi:MAG TPA: hypothetical protein VHX17_07405, partial [Candidatus Cybelea sp.]|nr:hypothetical protein [Candidatus Cybelea sp.]